MSKGEMSVDLLMVEDVTKDGVVYGSNWVLIDFSRYIVLDLEAESEKEVSLDYLGTV
jgi:hypothetical protein